MRFEKYNDVVKFMDDVFDILLENEIQNNLIISNCLRGKNGADISNWFMGVVKDNNGAVKLIAMMTPPFALCMYETKNIQDNKTLAFFVKEFVELKIEISNVLTRSEFAARFAEKYERISGKIKIEAKKMRIYRLDKVNDILISGGKLRKATENDLYYLPYWNNDFNLECGMNNVNIPKAIENIKNLIKNNNLLIWEDEIPVSKAAMGRETINGAVVTAVYTPQYYRGKGYATSCVAGLSKELLERGYKFCSLFTDMGNPISNSIYMKIGYNPICDYDEYKFETVLK